MRRLSPAVWVSAQLPPEAMSALAEAGVRRVINNRPDHEEQQRPLKGHCQQPLHHANEGDGGRQQNDKRHRPHLADHDFKRRHRHDEQVFDGAVLPLADESRTGQNNG